jgi:hypothetical protein
MAKAKHVQAAVPDNWRPEKLSPSSAGIWLNCAGSAAACECVPQGPSGPAAEEGTRAHLLLEVMFALGLRADEVPEQLDDEEVSAAMRKAVGFAVSYVEEWLHEHPGAELYSEHEISLTHQVADNVFGTGDVVGKHPDELLVMDFKFGRKKVHSKNNKQIMLYALGQITPEYRPERVRLAIVQPRLTGQDPVDEWETSSDELELWSDLAVLPVVNLINTMGPHAPRNAGDWCEWCRARGTCPELMALVFKTAGM